MEYENLKKKIDIAKKAAADETEFKNEVFLGIFLSELINKKEMTQAIKEVESVSKPKIKQLSIKEFLLEKRPKTDVQKVLAMGSFLETHESYSSFNIDDLKGTYTKAKEPIPQNINDKINMNIKKGFITEYPEKKEDKKSFHLTATGERVIEAGFETE